MWIYKILDAYFICMGACITPMRIFFLSVRISGKFESSSVVLFFLEYHRWGSPSQRGHCGSALPAIYLPAMSPPLSIYSPDRCNTSKKDGASVQLTFIARLFFLSTYLAYMTSSILDTSTKDLPAEKGQNTGPAVWSRLLGTSLGAEARERSSCCGSGSCWNSQVEILFKRRFS